MTDPKLIKTAVCVSGRLTSLENYDNIRQHIIEPYNADVFIDTWIPFAKNSMRITAAANPSPEGWQHISPTEALYVPNLFDEAPEGATIFPEEVPVSINQFADVWKPKVINLEFFDGMPLTYQIRRVLPKNTIAYDKTDSTGTNVENVMFMFYKVWKCNQLRKSYEQINRIKYDRVIRLRFDNTFDSYPMILPECKTVYIPNQADHLKGICDQHAIADTQTMDIYCELYNEIYRYITAGIGIHPESILRKHLEINRIVTSRFECGMKLRGTRA